MSLMHAVKVQAPILVLAIGNPSRGDDAFGPVLAGMLEDWLATQPHGTRETIELITDQQLMVEHAMDLSGRQHVLFVDAAAQGDAPVALCSLQVPTEGMGLKSFDSHRSSPTQLLALCEAVLGTPPPPSDMLTLTGSCFELDAAMSDQAQAHLPQAWSLMQGWLEHALRG